MYNISHAWPKIRVITLILILHQSTQIALQIYKGPHQALRCGVLDHSSELRLPADFPVLRWVVTGPHELATTLAVSRHFCNNKKRSTSKA
jgi:hypothetical protein